MWQFTYNDHDVATFKGGMLVTGWFTGGEFAVGLLCSALELILKLMLVWCLPRHLLQREEDLQFRLT